MIEGVLDDQLGVEVGLENYDISVKEIATQREVVQLREVAFRACNEEGYDGPLNAAGSLNEFCTAALNMIDIVDELASAADDFSLDDPSRPAT